jgi:uracil-DNA glycosylase
MHFDIGEVHPSWAELFSAHQSSIEAILDGLAGCDYTPARDNIFRAFKNPQEDIKVVIFGQDPYPGVGIADGYAFSSAVDNPIPASLRNIFKELSEDMALPMPTSPDLSMWAERGVLLLNRSLTTVVGVRNAHLANGWNIFTEAVARELAKQDVVAILWGKFAGQLAPLFKYNVESPHPSPLSAYKGFFGSKPFSRSNNLLRELGREEVNWQL